MVNLLPLQLISGWCCEATPKQQVRRPVLQKRPGARNTCDPSSALKTGDAKRWKNHLPGLVGGRYVMVCLRICALTDSAQRPDPNLLPRASLWWSPLCLGTWGRARKGWVMAPSQELPSQAESPDLVKDLAKFKWRGEWSGFVALRGRAQQEEPKL